MKKYSAASAAVQRHNPVISMLVILSTINVLTLLGLITQVVRT